MVIRYNLWLEPDNVARHVAVEADLERYFMESNADYPHLRLLGAHPYIDDAPLNRLDDVLTARAPEDCEHQWRGYVPSPTQLNRTFFRAVGRSNKFIRDSHDGNPDRPGS